MVPLCSRNAHNKNVLAWTNGTSWRASGWAGEKVARSEGQPGYALILALELPSCMEKEGKESCYLDSVL